MTTVDVRKKPLEDVDGEDFGSDYYGVVTTADGRRTSRTGTGKWIRVEAADQLSTVRMVLTEDGGVALYVYHDRWSKAQVAEDWVLLYTANLEEVGNEKETVH